MTKVACRILGHLWMIPNTIVSGLYLGFFMAMGWVRYAGWTPFAIVLAVKPGNWIFNYMKQKWAGWSSGAFIVVREDCLPSTRTIAHEQAHVIQQMILGVFQPILYVSFMLFIAIFFKTKSPYYDNPFEVQAREYAENFGPSSLIKKELGFHES